MQVHERYWTANKAKLALSAAVTAWLEEYSDLTYIEALQCLHAQQTDVLRWALRSERHPDQPDKKADEA